MAHASRSSTSDKSSIPNFMDMMKNFANFPTLLNRESMIKQHRKNLETINSCNAMAFEVMKSIGQLQAQFLKQSFEDIASSMRNYVQNMDHKEGSDSTGKMHSHVKRWTEYGHTMNALLTKSHRQMYEVLHNHLQESVGQVREMSKKAKKSHH